MVIKQIKFTSSNTISRNGDANSLQYLQHSGLGGEDVEGFQIHPGRPCLQSSWPPSCRKGQEGAPASKVEKPWVSSPFEKFSKNIEKCSPICALPSFHQFNHSSKFKVIVLRTSNLQIISKLRLPSLYDNVMTSFFFLSRKAKASYLKGLSNRNSGGLKIQMLFPVVQEAIFSDYRQNSFSFSVKGPLMELNV